MLDERYWIWVAYVRRLENNGRVSRLQSHLHVDKSQVAYRLHVIESYGPPGGIRTPDPLLRSHI